MSRPKLFNELEKQRIAMELFWKNGFHATSIQNLVDSLGINRASLYDTFGGKETLFINTLRLYQEEKSTEINTLLMNETSAKKAISLLFDHILTEIANDSDRKGCFLVNAIAEFFPGSGSIPDELKKMHASYENLFANILQEGKEEGEFHSKMNVPEKAAFLFSLYCGLKITSKVTTNPLFLKNAVITGLKVLE